MPLFEAPPEAVDKMYAKSLFELAEAEGGRARLEQLSGEIDEVAELTRAEPALSEFMSSMLIGVKERERSLDAIFKGRISDLLLRFLQVLNRKGRMSRFLPVAAAFDQMVQERFGRVEVDLYTRHPVPADQLESIRALLSAWMQREAVMHAYIDAGMIGGVKVQVGDRLLDASVATRLRKMKDLLTSEGGSLIRSRYDEAVEE